MDLVAVLDVYARSGLRWMRDEILAEAFVLNAVDRALAQAPPLIENSDQGSPFTSPQHTSRMETVGMRMSM